MPPSPSHSPLDLPNELLLCLADAIPSESDLNALTRTNRRLHALINGYLYRRNAQHRQSGTLALRWAAIRNRERTALLSLAAGADIEAKGSNSYSKKERNPFDLLAWKKHRRGKWQDWQVDLQPLTPLWLAIHFMSEAVARVLIKHGADIRTLSWPVGIGSIHAACWLGLADTVQVLLDRDAELLEHRDRGTQTLLHVAARGGDVRTVMCLLERNADRNAEDHRGKRPVDVAEDPAIADAVGQWQWQ
ncbi:ankyrin repeat-containing domain protein [Thermoascus aurantiacus ATCC 26904]